MLYVKQINLVYRLRYLMKLQTMYLRALVHNLPWDASSAG